MLTVRSIIGPNDLEAMNADGDRNIIPTLKMARRMIPRQLRSNIRPIGIQENSGGKMLIDKSYKTMLGTKYGTLKVFYSIAIKVLRYCGAVFVLKAFNNLVRCIGYYGHKLQDILQYGVEPKCDWYDHYIDLHYGWTRTGNPQAWERGIFNLMALRPGGKVLELCSGDGFNARYFYSAKAADITSIDLNPQAVSHARKYHRSGEIVFKQGDVRTDIPDEKFDNVIWDSAICLFTHEETDSILRTLKTRLVEDGIVCGHIGFEPDQTDLNVSRYARIDDLAVRLTPFFHNTRIFSTTYANRLNLYFYASDGSLPFDDDWPGMKRFAAARSDDKHVKDEPVLAKPL